MSNPARSACSGTPHSETNAASGYSFLTVPSISRQAAMVAVLAASSFLTSELAMSTRKPSQPWPSQKRMTSIMACRVSAAAGESTPICQGRSGWAKP